MRAGADPGLGRAGVSGEHRHDAFLGTQRPQTTSVLLDDDRVGAHFAPARPEDRVAAVGRLPGLLARGEGPSRDDRRLVATREQAGLLGAPLPEEMPDVALGRHIATLRSDHYLGRLQGAVAVPDRGAIAQGQRRPGPVVVRGPSSGALVPPGEHDAPGEVGRRGPPREGIHSRLEPVAGNAARRIRRSRREGLRRQGDVLTCANRGRASLLVGVHDQVPLGHDPPALRLLAGSREERQVDVGLGHDLLDRAVGPQGDLQPAADEMPRSSLAPPQVQSPGESPRSLHVHFHATRCDHAVEDLGRGVEGEDESRRREVVASLDQTGVVLEAEGPLGALQHRAAAPDLGGRLGLAFDPDERIRRELEAPVGRRIEEARRAPGDRLPPELGVVLGLCYLLVAAVGQGLALELEAVGRRDNDMAVEDHPRKGRIVEPVVGGDHRRLGLPPRHEAERHLHAAELRLGALLRRAALGLDEKALLPLLVAPEHETGRARLLRTVGRGGRRIGGPARRGLPASERPAHGDENGQRHACQDSPKDPGAQRSAPVKNVSPTRVAYRDAAAVR